MKLFLPKLFIAMNTLMVLLYANETESMDKIIHDVEVLRSNYEICQDTLSKKSTPTIVKERIECDTSVYDKHEKELNERIKALQAKIVKLKEEKELLSVVIDDFEKSKDAKVSEVKQTVCTPTVITKEIFNECTPEVNTKASKAKTYRVRRDASIYDNIGGKVIKTYEAKRSFTSNLRKDNWIKITGIFTEGKWTSVSNASLWIKAEDTIKHEKVVAHEQ